MKKSAHHWYYRPGWIVRQGETFVTRKITIATGESHSVREFLELAGEFAGVDWTRHVEIDPRYYRPTEVDFLLGDSSKAHRVLGWKPSVSFVTLVEMMTKHDPDLAQQEVVLDKAGHRNVARGVKHG